MHIILTLAEYQLCYKNISQYNSFIIQQRTKPKAAAGQFRGEGNWVDRWYPNSLSHALRLLTELGIGTESSPTMSELQASWEAVQDKVVAAAQAFDEERKKEKK